MPYVTHLFMCGIDSGRWLYGKQNEDRFIMLNNAIDVQTYTYDSNKRIEMRRQLNLTDDLVIGHVGRFNPQKNHSFLIDIFAALLKKNRTRFFFLSVVVWECPKCRRRCRSLA